MNITKEFLEAVLDNQEHSLAVVNSDFDIVYTNRAWNAFALANGIAKSKCWDGENYLEPCKVAAGQGDQNSILTLQGIKDIENGNSSIFKLEYPCHSLQAQRWFMMKISQFVSGDDSYFIISHHDVTQRVLLEQENKRLERLDGLTQIANRQEFKNFLDIEWSHCNRNAFPITLARIDLDDFKKFNDEYGYPVGDECLKSLAKILEEYTGRASDLCARFGGDEFVLAWGNISHEHAITLVNSILAEIGSINAEDAEGRAVNAPTVSIGLCTVVPSTADLDSFMSHTDKLLSQAKRHGKNRICAEFGLGHA